MSFSGSKLNVHKSSNTVGVEFAVGVFVLAVFEEVVATEAEVDIIKNQI